MNAPARHFGVYFHIPFCRSRCNYCGFVTSPWEAGLAGRYQEALRHELAQYFRRQPHWRVADTLYFGGGTPSLAEVEDIGATIELCRELFELAPGCEISLEANPGKLDADRAASYRELGINRVSIGAQSFDPADLEAAGRDHAPRDIDDGLRHFRRHSLYNLNLDLILGLPSQTETSWQANLDRIAVHRTPHLSIYMLDLDPKIPLYHRVLSGAVTLPGQEWTVERYRTTLRTLARLGYRHYEISNFCLPGFACRHNLKYWRREPVLGFGVSSHSFDGLCRYQNHDSLHRYLEAVESGTSPVSWRHALDDTEVLQETLLLGLRLDQGVDWARLRHRFERRLSEYEPALSSMTAQGLLEWSDTGLRLTTEGILLSNEVFQTFV